MRSPGTKFAGRVTILFDDLERKLYPSQVVEFVREEELDKRLCRGRDD